VAACSSGAPPQPPRSSADTPGGSPYVYRCDSGKTITAVYPSTDTATVQYQGASYGMHIAMSGSGARYVGDGMQWWTKGPSGMLSPLQADGSAGTIIETCSER